MPVGKATLGRILNVLGEPVDEAGPLAADGEELRGMTVVSRPDPLQRGTGHQTGGDAGAVGHGKEINLARL